MRDNRHNSYAWRLPLMAAVQNPQQALVASRIVAGKVGRMQYSCEFLVVSVVVLHILYQHIAIGTAGYSRTAQLTELLLL